MAPTQTNDKFGFVGAHVLRQTERKGRRRPRNGSTNGHAMKPDPGAAAEDSSDSEKGNADGDVDMVVEGFVLHGWVTRYDARLELYTLFDPATSTTTLHTREELLKFGLNAAFQLRKAADPAFPPPTEDTGSRFVDAPVRKATGRLPRHLLDADREVEGRVVCFLPFADAYRVAFEDGSTQQLSESEVVDALLLYAKRAKQQGNESERHEQKGTQETHADTEMEVETTVSRGRKRRRSEDFTPDTSAGAVEDDGEETEDEEPPPELLRNAAVKTEARTSALEEASHVVAPPVAAPVEETVSSQPRDDETVDVKMQPVENAAASSWEQVAAPVEPSEAPTVDANVSPPAPANTEPTVETHSPPSADEDADFPAAIDDDMEEPIDIPTPEDDDEDLPTVSTSPATAATASTTSESFEYTPPEPVSFVPEPEVISLLTDYSSTTRLPLPLPLARPPPPSGPPPLSYIVDVPRHVPTNPLDKRSMAFEFVRTELTRLIESDECKKLEIKLVADVLANRDIKDRDAIRRFVETGGLVAVNRVLNVRSSDALATKTQRFDRVLFVLKLLAMLPTPSEQQVMESVIGKTIGRFIKSRLTDQQTQADPEMPKTIPHLAKWIKHKWVANMKRSGDAPKPKEDARRKTPTMVSKSSAAAASKSAASSSKKHLQRPTHGRPPGQRSNDPEPIPRLATRTPLPPPPPPVLSFTAASAAPSAPAAAAAATSASGGDVLGSVLSSRGQPPPKSSLKPDWMRQKEALSRSRFTITTDAHAERQHYRQRERANAITHDSVDSTSSSSTNSSSTSAANAPRPPPPMENPGDRGVFGRPQRLAFGPRWNVCEFFKDAPPSAVRRVASTASSSSYSRPTAAAPPKSILRRDSKYNNDLHFGI